MDRIVDAQKTKNIERVDRGMAIAAVIQAIPTVLWVAMIVLLFGFIGIALWFNHNDLSNFTSQVLMWLLIVLIAVSVVLLVRWIRKVYKSLYHDIVMEAQDRRIATANASKAVATARQQELKNQQLEATINLQRNLLFLVHQLADTGNYHIDLDTQRGTLKAQNAQALAMIGQGPGQGQLAGGNAPQLRAGKPLAIQAPRELPGPFDLLGIFQNDIAPEHLFIGLLDGGEPFY
jgi:hypothetical protein